MKTALILVVALIALGAFVVEAKTVKTMVAQKARNVRAAAKTPFTRTETETFLKWLYGQSSLTNYIEGQDPYCAEKFMNALIDCTCRMGWLRALLSFTANMPQEINLMVAARAAYGVWDGITTCNRAKKGELFQACKDTLVVNTRSSFTISRFSESSTCWCEESGTCGSSTETASAHAAKSQSDQLFAAIEAKGVHEDSSDASAPSDTPSDKGVA